MLRCVIFLLSLQFVHSIHIDAPTEIIRILNSGYNKYETPNQKEDGTTMVVIGFYIEGMSSIRAQTMDFHVDIYFEQRWVDKRLTFGTPNSQRILIRDPVIFERMWHPDLYFANANSAHFFNVMAPNFFLWVFPNGTVHHDCRISLTVLCNMDLTKYPLDAQTCEMRILSYAYTWNQLNITWRKIDPIAINSDLRLPDMHIESNEATYCSGEYSTGTWACVRAVFHLRREIMYHILQSYIPTFLIVIVSWFSFWLDVESVPGRVSLCITTLLTLTSQASSAKLALPQVSYAKAIDVWMEACLGMVFGVLIEFTLVNYLARRHKQFRILGRKARKLRVRHMGTSPKAVRADWSFILNNALDYEQPEITAADIGVEFRKLATAVDRKCRICFPCAFALFNALYWPYYMIFT